MTGAKLLLQYWNVLYVARVSKLGLWAVTSMDALCAGDGTTRVALCQSCSTVIHRGKALEHRVVAIEVKI